LHINGGVKFGKVIRARTLQNRWSCWADPADNESAVMQYGTKMETRVQPLPNFGNIKQSNRKGGRTSKDKAIEMLMAGLTPVQICAASPDVYFTHHRSIKETFTMLELCRVQNPSLQYTDSEEE